jgi:hypothetical protein
VKQPVIDYARPGTARIGVPGWLWAANATATLVSAGLCLGTVVLAWRHAAEAAGATWVLTFGMTTAHLLTVLPITWWQTRHDTGRRGRGIRLLALTPALLLMGTIAVMAAVRLVRGALGG